MYRFFNGLLIVGTIQLLSACAVTPATKNALVEVRDADLTSSNRRPSVVEVEPGKPAVLYVNKAGRVAVKLGDETKLIDVTARVKEGASYAQLNKYGTSGLQALWWSHSDGKNIYMTTSTDGGKSFTPVDSPNSDHGVLVPFTLLPGSTPSVFGVVYTDERLPGYQVYANRSTDGGRTWSEADKRLDTPPTGGRSSSAQDPVALKTANGSWVVVWADTSQEDGKAAYRLMSTVSKDDGISWAEPKVVFVTDRFISTLVGSVENNTLVVAADVLGRGIVAIISQDAGAQWTSAGVAPGADKVENSGLRMAQKNGVVNFVWMKGAEGAKTQVMRARVDAKTATWLDGGAKRMDVKVHDTTKSMSPEVVAVDGGTLVSVWTDYREIVPNLYHSVSTDEGKTWQPNTPILNLAKEWPAGWSHVMPWTNGIAIAQAERDAFKFGTERFVVKQITVEALKAGSTRTSDLALEIAGESKGDRLRQRVEDLWRARIESNADKAYDVFDPVYRALNTKEAYKDSVGPLSYLEFSIGDISIKGNEAKVNVTTKYEVKPIQLPNLSAPFKLAPTDVTADTKWVWIVNDWFQVYSSIVLKEQPLDY